MGKLLIIVGGLLMLVGVIIFIKGVINIITNIIKSKALKPYQKYIDNVIVLNTYICEINSLISTNATIDVNEEINFIEQTIEHINKTIEDLLTESKEATIEYAYKVHLQKNAKNRDLRSALNVAESNSIITKKYKELLLEFNKLLEYLLHTQEKKN